MQLVLVQPDVSWERPSENFRTVDRLVASAPVSPGALVVLPEMFSVGFTMNVAGVAEEEGGPSETYLRDLAARFEVFVIGGVVRRGEDGRGRNVALVVNPSGDVVARYTKLHPFTFASETEHYAPGNEVVVFDWAGWKTAPFICYDLRFPEAYRTAVLQGAELFVTIANFPTARVRHWTSLLVARAVENQAFSVGVNRCGSDPNVSYPGRSLVVDPLGRIRAEAAGTEEVIVVDVERDRVTRYRDAFPALRDIRSDFLSNPTS